MPDMFHQLQIARYHGTGPPLDSVLTGFETLCEAARIGSFHMDVVEKGIVGPNNGKRIDDMEIGMATGETSRYDSNSRADAFDVFRAKLSEIGIGT